MVDVFLIVVVCLLAVALIFINFYLLALYCHPDDRDWGMALFCKILVILGFTLSWAQVLMLPLDVANSRGQGAGIDMATFWKAIYITVLIFTVILIPFASYLYESDEDQTASSRICYALYLELMTIIVVSLILFISWAFLQYADIPIKVYTINIDKIQNSVAKISELPGTGVTAKDVTLEYQVSFPVYVMAITAFIGWFFFVLFGGVGLSALPIDLILDFINRPKMRSSQDVAETKRQLKLRCSQLVEQGNKLKEQEKEIGIQQGWWARRRKKGQVQSQVNRFKVNVLTLEKEHQIFQMELNYLDVNPLVFIFKLILGIIFVIVSILWWLHILLFIAIKSNGFPSHPFLNKLLTGLETSGVTFLATAVYAFLALYMLWCTQKGNIKFGVRIPFLFTLHPMKVNETWMNSFLFNVNLILICSVAVTQFCSTAFSQYARLTEIDMMFNTQIRYLRFFTWFYDNQVFEYGILIWSFLTMMFLLIRPNQQPKALKEIEALKQAQIR